MRGKGWRNGAQLLDIWFARPLAVAPGYGPPDTGTIQMHGWALTFARAREVYNRLIRDRIWANPLGQVAVAGMLRRKGLLTQTPQTVSFGQLSDPVPQQDRDYVNQRPAGSYDTFDDLTAALGRFNFRVVVAGTVGPVPQRPGWQVEVSEVGVYIYDSFDFEGNQYLGCWSDNPDGFLPVMPPAASAGIGGMAMPLTPPQFTPIGNRDFREWRTRNSKGGDFLVYSDMLRVPLNPPDRFIVL